MSEQLNKIAADLQKGPVSGADALFLFDVVRTYAWQLAETFEQEGNKAAKKKALKNVSAAIKKLSPLLPKNDELLRCLRAMHEIGIALLKGKEEPKFVRGKGSAPDIGHL